MLRCLISHNNDPYFNLAAEEYFLKSDDDEMFLIYVNNPAIVVGKHQNLLAEINVPWSYENNIRLCRRISGGGTVYHDLGNINFSFINNCPNLEKVNYKSFTYPVVQALRTSGIDAEYSSKNDLLLKDFKISGNAMHIFKNRVLCHGTLLYNSDLKNLSIALRNHPERYIDRSIKSISSKVVNISNHSNKPLSTDEFKEHIFNETLRFLDFPVFYSLTEQDIASIKCLAEEKYSSWDWIMGYSPKYVFKNTIELKESPLSFELTVEKGIISGYSINEDGKNSNIELIFNKLIKYRHDYNAIRNLLNGEELKNTFPEYSWIQFCNALF